MKKLIYCAAALAAMIFAGSCQQENLEPVAQENTVTYTVKVPEVQTKAIGEASTVNQLIYEVYKTEAPEVTDLTDPTKAVRLYQAETGVLNGEATVTLNLVQDQEYTILFWAQVLNTGAYNTESLTNVHYNKDYSATDEFYQSNVENYAAFYAVEFVSDSDDKSRTVTLTRPFAQLNIGTLNTADEYTVTMQQSEVTVTKVPTGFNVATKEALGEGTVVFNYNNVPSDPATLKVNNEGYEYVAMNYIFADATRRTTTVTYNIKSTLTSEYNEEVSAEKVIVNNTIEHVPFTENYRTNIVGNLLTSTTKYDVIIDADFQANQYVVEGGVNSISVSSAEELVTVFEEIANGDINTDEFEIMLGGDIDLNDLVVTRAATSSNWTPIGTSENPFTGVFNGNGYTIKNLTLVESEAKEGKAYIGFFGYAEDATIKNVTFENVYINIPCLDIDHSQGHIGAVAGSLEGTSVIENVTVKGDVTVYATQTANGASRVAVVAGGNSYGDVTMKNVHVIANEGSSLIANNNTGALAGQLQGKMYFENCSSNIDVTVNKFFAGGLVGIAAGDSYIKDCHTTGDVAVVAGREGRHNDEYRVGGIAGGWADGKTKVCILENCSYTGNVSGKNADGAVAEPLDYMGYVGRGYTLNNCEGSKVIIDGVEFVQVGNAAPFGNYAVNGVENPILVKNVEELNAALANADVTNILLLEGEYGTIVAKSSKTIAGTPNAKVDAVVLNGSDNVTLKNIVFDAATAVIGYDGSGNVKQYANIVTDNNGGKNTPNKGSFNIVIDGCTFEGTFAKGGTAIAFTDQSRSGGFTGNVTVKNCTFNTVGSYYDIYGHYTGNGLNGYGDFVIENNVFNSVHLQGLPVYLGRYASSIPVVVKGNAFNTVTSLGSAVYVQDHSNYGVSINDSENTFAN